MRKRFLGAAAAMALAAASTLVVGAGAAGADAPPGAQNCAGAFISALTPGFTSTDPPSFGRSRSELAPGGGTGEAEKAATEQLANCGL